MRAWAWMGNLSLIIGEIVAKMTQDASARRVIGRRLTRLWYWRRSARTTSSRSGLSKPRPDLSPLTLLVTPQLVDVLVLADFFVGFGFDLADALSGNSEFFTYLLQCVGDAV